ncbi:hypothetical protein BGX33_011791, partial [Mortierella sp. NVP41]
MAITPNVQAIRSVHRTGRAGPTAPDPADVLYVDVYTDPVTKKGFVLWDDIKLAFDAALHVRHQAKVVPFLKGEDLNPIKPFRIAASPDVVLDVVVRDPQGQPQVAAPQPS